MNFRLRRGFLPLSACAVLLCAATPVLAQAPAPASRLTPEQAISLRRLSDLQWSPDGTRLAFTVAEPPSGTERRSHIWIYETATRQARQFTASAKADHDPRWSPDGRQLAFLSNRDEGVRIYLMPLDGGEARALTDAKHHIDSFEWAADGRHLACIGSEPKSDADETREKDKDDARVVDRDDKPARLWLADAASGELRRVIGAPWKIEEAQWLPGSAELVVVATDRPEVEQPTSRIFRVRADDGVMHPVAAPGGPFGRVRVAPDGASVAFVGSRRDGPAPHDLYVQPLDGSPARNLTAVSVDWPIADYAWRHDGTLMVLGQDGFRDGFWTMAADGRATGHTAPGMAVSDVALSPSGELWFVGENSSKPPELWQSAEGKTAEVRSTINAGLAAAPLTAATFVRYQGADGRTIEAGLLQPAGTPSGPRPTVVLVHGGPTGAWRDQFEPWGQLLASAGYVVFYPNIRGSSGYGFEFLASNRADWGGGDFRDVMAGVDDLVARHIADPARLGIGGWSYGGYMASWAITQTTRFKAAITGAGMSDLAAEFGTEDNPAYDEWFWGLPYERPEGFRKFSPLTYVAQARTPTLILQGEADVVDPVGQSQALYRALKHYGVETELVLYPREGHGLREERHLLDRLRRVVAWYDKHLQTP